MSGLKVAFLFPGQGSQAVGMGLAMAEGHPEARSVFEEADAALGFDLSGLCFKGPEERLRLTENTQPCLLAVSIACERVLRARGVSPSWVAGHSLGEYSALVSAGALELPVALRLVQKRGRYMQEAVPVGAGAMAAIVGLKSEAVEQLCKEEAGSEVLSAANYNSPEQTVISGTAAAVERAVVAAPGKGAKRAVRLPVSAPFHCALMGPARDRLEGDLTEARFADLTCPLVANVDAQALAKGAEARRRLVEQVTAPVYWEASVREVARLGAKTLIEVGPGRVLTTLARRIVRDCRLLNVEDPASLERTLNALKEET